MIEAFLEVTEMGAVSKFLRKRGSKLKYLNQGRSFANYSEFYFINCIYVELYIVYFSDKMNDSYFCFRITSSKS